MVLTGDGDLDAAAGQTCRFLALDVDGDGWPQVGRRDPGRREGRALGRGRDLEVVGESFYQDNLRRLAGARPGKPVRVEITAVLAAEDDNPYDRNAIAVWDGSGSAPLGRGSRDRQPAPHGAPWAQPGPTQRLTAVRLKSARRPKKPSSRAFNGVSEGTRTPDTQDHNNAVRQQRTPKPLLFRDF